MLTTSERVDCKQPQIRGRVNHDILVAPEHLIERIAKEQFATELTDETHLDASQLASARDHVEAVHVADNRVRRDAAAGEHVNEAEVTRAAVEPELAGKRGLRIAVDKQHPTPATGK